MKTKKDDNSGGQENVNLLNQEEEARNKIVWKHQYSGQQG
jgi:hypothetical protein